MILEMDAVFADFAQLGERPYLEPSAVSEDGTVPVHECMETPEVLDDLRARPDGEMISVTENDFTAKIAKFVRADCLDTPLGSHRHEYRGLDATMGRGETSAPGRGGWILVKQFKQGLKVALAGFSASIR